MRSPEVVGLPFSLGQVKEQIALLLAKAAEKLSTGDEGGSASESKSGAASPRRYRWPMKPRASVTALDSLWFSDVVG